MVEVQDAQHVVRDMPLHYSVYELHDDGTYSEICGVTPDVYFCDTHAESLWKRDIVSHIKESYGKYVGVLHEHVASVVAPNANTFKYVLGRWQY